MSALNVIRQRDRVVLVTDGAVWDVNAGIILGFPAKQVTLPSLPAVFATRGAPLATPVFAFLLGYRFQSFLWEMSDIVDMLESWEAKGERPAAVA